MSILPVHIAAGSLALVLGYVALFAAKGSILHRRSGLGFVGAMIVMSLTGALIAFLGGEPVSQIAGLLTFYFVTTSLLTVRRPQPGSSGIDAAAMIVALAVALFAFGTGVRILGSSPAAFPMFIFGAMGLLGAAGDLRMMRAGGIDGPNRIKRHLWRMCFAMWVAAASFFWGPQQRVPEMIRIPLLQAIAVLIPLGVMVYWLWRYRRRRRAVRAITSDGAVGTA